VEEVESVVGAGGVARIMMGRFVRLAKAPKDVRIKRRQVTTVTGLEK
jgi:hypothetical protein